ncbi:esterase/lipase family protein [Streptomyces sp. NPDC047928]|uniref:esterase/lipase family protein n=1 Tax=unclassified Streptomyces TaxID=2593676 RepID=UPI00371828B4
MKGPASRIIPSRISASRIIPSRISPSGILESLVGRSGVARALPLLPLLSLPSVVLRSIALPSIALPSVALPSLGLPSAALLKAGVLELAILTGHVFLYPTGLVPERRTAPAPGPTAHRTSTPAPAPAVSVGRTEPPVVLLHGFIDNRSVFVLLRRSLARQGRRRLEALNYSPLTCDIRAAAELLGRRVEELCARTGHAEVDIVGHSLGGLIARYYVQRLGGDRRVRVLVTLGTPHSGTAVAPPAGIHPLVRQMRPGSSVLRELSEPAPGCRTRFVGFWSELDQIMVPVETARVSHPDLIARNVRVSGIGHLALPVHPAVVAAIREALESGGEAEGAGGSASVA